MKIIQSKKRSPEPISIKISANVILTATGAVNINVPFLVNHVDFFPSSFKLEAHGKVIYIDPVAIDDADALPADYILITHSHADHFSIPDIKKLTTKESGVICPKDVYKKLSKKFPGCTLIEIRPGDKMEFEKITIESIAAYNLKSGFLTAHPKSSMNVSYIISIDDVKLYHAGDTDYVPEMNDMKNITAALTPIDGNGLTMSTEKAVEFINNLKPKFTIPMHYTIGTDQIEKFKRTVNADTQVIIMDGQK